MDTDKDIGHKGLECRVCGQFKQPEHFYLFIHLSEDDKRYFAKGIPTGEILNHICFECQSPYRCIACGEVKDASHYRIQGRVCRKCKSKKRTIRKIKQSA